MNVWRLPRSECRSVVFDAKVRLGAEAGQAAAYAEWDRIWRERIAANIDRREARADNVCVFHRRQA